jgi:hypothetical protein
MTSLSHVCLAVIVSAAAAAAQEPTRRTGPLTPEEMPKRPAPVERLGPDTLRMGQVTINTATREITVPGQVNDVPVLEFVANTKDGWKAYESALTLETDGITINTALVLIGLDPANATPPKEHFDPSTLKGDPLEVWVSWTDPAGRTRRVRAQEVVYNVAAKKTLPEEPWVYIGSGFNEGGYLADQMGVVISFAHTPAAIIEHPSAFGIGNYGAWRLNPSLDLKGGMPVTVTIASLKKPRPD